MWQEVTINSFLKERKNRYKFEEANKLNLKRLDKIDFSGKMHFSEGRKSKTGMILIKKGDLVISGINVEKGAISVYRGEEDALATIHYSSYEFDKSKIDISYFKWFLISKVFKDILKKQVKGGIKTELKPKSFLPLKIKLPEKNEQIKIREKLEEIISETKEVKNIEFENESYLKSLRSSILSEAVQGKLVPQDPKDEPASELLKKIKAEKDKLIREKKIKKDKPLPPISEEEKPYELPNGWQADRLGNITTLITKGTTPTTHGFEYLDSGINFIKVEDIHNGKIVPNRISKFISDEANKFLKRSQLKEKDILFSIAGSIGTTCIVEEKDLPANTNQALAIIRGYGTVFNTRYLRMCLDSIISSRIKSRARGGAMNNISLLDVREMVMPIPPLSEQHRIVEKVDKLMKLCDEIEEKVKENRQNAEKLMEAVLREAFEDDHKL
jgi:type I restriction enzyme S subunit